MRLGIAAALLAAAVCACQRAPERPVPGGDIERGGVALRQHACTTCHEIPGLVEALDARMGPSLDDLAARTYIAGHLPNTTDNLIGWIVDPEAVDPLTAMPDLGVDRQDARDMAAYLYSDR